MTDREQPVDELHETKEDLQLPGRFGEYLRFGQGALLQAFERADREALRTQKKYRRVTAWAAILGTAAIFASTAHRISADPPVLAVVAELVLAVASAGAVLWGILAGWHERWLISRYQAEQYRLLKFDFLTDAVLWTQPADVWQLDLKHRIQDIASVVRANLELQADRENVAKIVAPELSGAIPESERAAISRYYIRRRLEVQIQYFSRIGSRESWGLLRNSRLIPIVFFGSMALLSIHLIREIDFRLAVHGKSLLEATPRMSPGFLLASLLVPAVWAGLRTFRSANQFGRNRARSSAKGWALTQVARRIEVGPPPLGSLFQNISLAESVLAADQGEWLRLMIEAEWYG